MPAGIVVKVNNFGFDLTFTILNADGTIRDLTPYTAVTVYVYTQDQEPTLLFSGTCTVVAPMTGVAVYTVMSTNLSQIGTFDAEIEMTTVASLVTTYLEDTETFSFNIIPRHPIS